MRYFGTKLVPVASVGAFAATAALAVDLDEIKARGFFDRKA